MLHIQKAGTGVRDLCCLFSNERGHSFTHLFDVCHNNCNYEALL